MPIWKNLWVKGILILSGIIIFAVLSLVISHYLLLSQDKSFVYVLDTKWIDRIFSLGKAREIGVPGRLKNSYNTYFNEDGEIVRNIKNVHNVVIDREENGEIFAKDIERKTEARYDWNDDTTYVCINSEKTADIPVQEMIDNNYLRNFEVYFLGMQMGGVKNPFGYFGFLEDYQPGYPAKMYLKSGRQNTEGGYDLLTVALFIGVKKCYLDDIEMEKLFDDHRPMQYD